MVFNFNRKICGRTSILGNLRVNSNAFDANNEIVLLDTFNPSSQDAILGGKISSFAAEDVCNTGLFLMVKLDLLFGLEKTWRWIGLHFTPNNADGSIVRLKNRGPMKSFLQKLEE
ncbi:hypothetical protein PVK06_040225 [Gossypium arboreum]|uniref:Uncharacterized protein n=1 Tax=Gossypium arboreum TaxID=29729 RepID=A0ABR0N5N9_GOSAR|nr:hypothetical protein PVK06_040225 [Gossypium arboreum]